MMSVDRSDQRVIAALGEMRAMVHEADERLNRGMWDAEGVRATPITKLARVVVELADRLAIVEERLDRLGDHVPPEETLDLVSLAILHQPDGVGGVPKVGFKTGPERAGSRWAYGFKTFARGLEGCA